MSDRLPSLTALRAFEAAARYMSFAQAAAELHVTPAALSYQIKSLEEHLGAPLFIRLNRAVELTEAGRALAPGVSEGFQALSNAWRSTKRLQDNTTLNVTAGPAFTSKWMAPRLYEFARAHPDIDLRFSAALRIMDFDRDEVDVAIRFGYGQGSAADDGLWSQPLSSEWYTPVMTPDMAERYPTPESLIDAPLIFDESTNFLRPQCDWATWFRAVGVDHNPSHGLHFSGADHAVDAALAGVGAVLGRRAMVIKDIFDGRLVAPYGVALGTKAHFRFLCRLGTENRPQIVAFRDWMLAEIAKTISVHQALTIVPVEEVVPA